MSPLHQLLRRTQLRLRLRRVVVDGHRSAVVASSVVVLTMIGRATGLLEPRLVPWAIASAGLGVLAAAVAAAARPLPTVMAAFELDRSAGLRDRLRSALDFSGRPHPTALERAAILDAHERAATIDLRRILPIGRPRRLWRVPLLLGAAAVIWSLPDRPGREPAPPPITDTGAHATRADPGRPSIEASAAAALLGQLDHILPPPGRSSDPTSLGPAAAAARALAELTTQLARGAVDRAQALARLASLERGLGATVPREDLDAARRELERLSREAQRLEAERDPGTPRKLGAEAEHARSELDRVDKALKELAARERDLQEEKKALERQLREHPEDAEAQRRLDRNRRELERLEREREQAERERRQLERLERALREAADELRRQLSPEALRRLEQQLEQMQDELRGLENAERVRLAIAELREVLRQSPSPGNGRPAEKGQPDSGHGGSQRADFDQRARGQAHPGPGQGETPRPGEQQQSLLLGQQGDSAILLPLPGRRPSPTAQSSASGEGDQPSGQEIGDGHDPDLLGAATRLDGRLHDTRLPGQNTQGPSRSRTIAAAASRGFSTSAYHRVYADYGTLIEEGVADQRIPPDRRQIVRRYFDLIKPRN